MLGRDSQECDSKFCGIAFFDLCTPEGKVMLVLELLLCRVKLSKIGFCKDRTLLRRRVTFYQAFYNFTCPHQSLRLHPPDIELEQVALIQHKWQSRTPGMAAGMADYVWSFRELFTAKFEPIHCQSISG